MVMLVFFLGRIIVPHPEGGQVIGDQADLVTAGFPTGPVGAGPKPVEIRPPLGQFVPLMNEYPGNPGSKLPAMLNWPCFNHWTARHLLNRVRRHGVH